MSKDKELACYWIIAKKIEDSKWRKFHSSGFFELISDFQYWEFSPSNPNDFVQKKAYGRIEKRNKIQWMYHYYVLFMSESEAEVDEALVSGKNPSTGLKIANPSRRKSIGDSKFPLSAYTFRTELKSSQSKVKTSQGAKDSAKQKICAEIAEKFQKQRMDSKSNVAGNSSVHQKPCEELLENDDDSEFKKMKRAMDALRKENDAMKEALSQQASRPPLGIDQEQIVKVLARDLAKEVSDKVLQEVKKSVPRAIESCSKLGSCPGKLEKLRNAMDPSKEPSENLEEGEVYMGCERPVFLSDLIKVQRNHFTFTSRVNALLDLIWGSNNVHLYYSGKTVPSSGRHVSDDIKTCICNILIGMKWSKEDETEISEGAVRRQIEKQTSYKRSVAKRKLLPSPEKRRMQEKMKARKKQLAEAGVKKQFVIRNRKRVKVKGPAAPPLPPAAKRKKSSSKEESCSEGDKATSRKEKGVKDIDSDPPGREGDIEENWSDGGNLQPSDESSDECSDLSPNKSDGDNAQIADFDTGFEEHTKKKQKKTKKRRKDDSSISELSEVNDAESADLSPSEFEEEESKKKGGKKKMKKRQEDDSSISDLSEINNAESVDLFHTEFEQEESKKKGGKKKMKKRQEDDSSISDLSEINNAESVDLFHTEFEQEENKKRGGKKKIKGCDSETDFSPSS